MTDKQNPGQKPELSSPPIVVVSTQGGATTRKGGLVDVVLRLKSELTSLSQISEKGEEFNNKVKDLIELSSSGDISPVVLTLGISGSLKDLNIPEEAHVRLISDLLNLRKVGKSVPLQPVKPVEDLPDAELRSVGQDMFNRLNSVAESGGPLHAVQCPKGLSVSDYQKLLRSTISHSLMANRKSRLLRLQVDSLRSKIKSLRSRVQSVQEIEPSKDS